MRNKNTHSLTIKGKLNKKKGVFVAFNQLQFKYGQLLDKDDEIVEIQANYSLKDFSFGNNYTSDFVCKKSNGELKIRGCIYRKNIMKFITSTFIFTNFPQRSLNTFFNSPDDGIYQSLPSFSQ